MRAASAVYTGNILRKMGTAYSVPRRPQWPKGARINCAAVDRAGCPHFSPGHSTPCPMFSRVPMPGNAEPRYAAAETPSFFDHGVAPVSAAFTALMFFTP